MRNPYTGLRHLEDEDRRPGAVPRHESELPDPKRRRLWTAEETRQVRIGLEMGETHAEIGWRIGRTDTSVCSHVVYLRKVGRLEE